MSAAAIPAITHDQIVVDLDGTLVHADTFISCILEALRRRPACVLALIVALFKGRAHCKQLAAKLGPLQVSSLPYNEPLIQHLRAKKASGAYLVLASGADLSVATAVANYLGIFDYVIASDGTNNLTGSRKLSAVQDLLGETPFVYAANSHEDLSVWKGSRAAILVGASRSCAATVRHRGIAVEREFTRPRPTVRTVLRCLRWHQWSKNGLVFVPALLAHRMLDLSVMGHSALAFLAFSFCASALYVVNDLLDLQADRIHPTKRRRPLAAGLLSVQAGVSIAAMLMGASVLCAFLLPWPASVLLLLYACSSLLYSFKLKRLLFIDVVCLSLLYVLRVFFGGSATGIKISVWTLAFSLFLFASLATVKRLAELRRANAGASLDYRAYKDIDTTQVSSLAAAGGYVAVLVLALYINSPEVVLLYRHAQGLWLLCPLLIYWLGRLTLIANRGDLDEDPVSFALKDKTTWFLGVVAAAVLALST